MKKSASKDSRPCKYLDLNALRQGDLILTRGPDRESAMIARNTNGPFSHVAILRSFWQRFEALGDGVGLTNHSVDRVERRGERLCLLMRIEDEECVVLRHRAAGAAGEETRQKYERAELRLIGVRYASLDRLLLALPETHLLRPMARPVVKRLSSLRRKSLVHRLRPPGLFCSELVAEIYAELGWELPGVASAGEISPNDLHRLSQRGGPIEPIAEVVVEPDDSCLVSDEEVGKIALVQKVRDEAKNYPPGRYKVDEMIKEKDSMYARRAIHRHLREVISHGMGKYIDCRREKRPVRVAWLQLILDQLEQSEARAREAEEAAGLNRREPRLAGS